MAHLTLRYQSGFTLVELACTLVVLLVLLEGGLSLSDNLLPHARLVSDTNQVIGLLGLARQRALGHEPMMVCAAGSDCTHFPDTDGLILVIDSNRNAQRDTDETVLAHIRLHAGTHLSWHSFRNLPNLTYRQNGMSYFQNGHLLLCTKKGASKVVVNWIGRPHVEKVNDPSVCGN